MINKEKIRAWWEDIWNRSNEEGKRELNEKNEYRERKQSLELHEMSKRHRDEKIRVPLLFH